MKKIFFILMLTLSLSVLTACDKKEDTSLEKITLVLDWTPNTNHTGIFVARDKGYFKEQGLDVKIVQAPEDGAEALTASGNADFGISFQDSIAPAFAQAEPLPVTAVAAILQHNTSGLVSLKDKNIDSPKDLEGKTYATWDLPVEKAMVQSIMEKDGGDFSKLKLIPSTVTDIVSALETNIDSVWIFEAWDGMVLKSKDITTNYLDFKDINPIFDYYTPILIGNNNFLEKNPETSRKFLTALNKGYEFCIDNPKEAGDILLKEAPELDENLVRLSQEFLSKEYKADASQWGIISKSRWNGFYNWLYDNKLIDTKIEDDFGFTNDFLPVI